LACFFKIASGHYQSAAPTPRPSGGFMGSHRYWRVLFAGFFALSVAACGGGGGFDGGDDDGSTPPTGPKVSVIKLLASSPQLSSNAQTAATGVTLTAIALDANQNVVAGATVLFSTTDPQAVLLPVGTLTDAGGQVQASLTTGGDPTNRSVTVTAKSGSVSSTVNVAVVGTTLTISGPASAQFNTPTQYTALLVDSGGGGISGRTVNVTTNPNNLLSASTLTTNGSGSVSFTLTPTQASSFVTVTALGLTATQNVTVSQDQFVFLAPSAGTLIVLAEQEDVSVSWTQGGAPVPDGTLVKFSATRGTFAAAPGFTLSGANEVPTQGGVATVRISSDRAGEATITASSSQLTKPTNKLVVQFIATTADSVDVQADPAVIPTNDASSISAIVRDANNNLVASKEVEFELIDNSGGTITSSLATTSNLGIARITYNSSSITSAQDGVRINATARNSNGTSATDFVTLTVGRRALRITLGTGNEIFEPNESVYALPYSAIVTDAAGNPPTGASFNLSTFPLRYYKGEYAEPIGGGDPVAVYSVPGGCLNEDLNRNGVLDPGEDVNENGRLEPGTVATVPSSPALGANGTVQFLVTYPQDRGNWIDLELRARASVSGTEATEVVSFKLPISEDDADNPPGPVSPYGTGASCDDPN
jgi:hypothetical protein